MGFVDWLLQSQSRTVASKLPKRVICQEPMIRATKSKKKNTRWAAFQSQRTTQDIRTANDNTIILPTKPHAIDPSVMATPSSQRPRSRNIPQENLLVPTHTREPGIILRHGDIQHLIPMRRVLLHQPRSGRIRRYFRGVIEMDSAIRGTGQDLGK